MADSEKTDPWEWAEEVDRQGAEEYRKNTVFGTQYEDSFLRGWLRAKVAMMKMELDNAKREIGYLQGVREGVRKD